ncbi:tellurite resistance TerB family protein [Aliarcobacter cryaerophilus]|uniref:tellurite resistance TerB family protein n=1 Tax=Aliarcobacter cryaerophilus TaxID=28198 RepID=UPI000826EB1A|nr:TerB family tellurite resistance protein [Aliarcobacter cryaerophilus]
MVARIVIGIGSAIVAAVGTYATKDYFDQKEKDEEKAKENKRTAKTEEALNEHKEHTNYILGLTALGISMARVDDNILQSEIIEIKEYINGMAGEKLPKYIKDEIEKIIQNPPTFNEAMAYLDRLKINKVDEIRNLLVSVMEADGYNHPKEEAFLKAFDLYMDKKKK